MEGIIKLSGAAVAAAMAILLMKQAKSELYMFAGLASAVGAGIYCVSVLSGMVLAVSDAAVKFGVDNKDFGAVFKIVGICIICDFTSDFCRESGLGALANNVEMAGKLGIAAISLPLAMSLLEITVTLLSG